MIVGTPTRLNLIPSGIMPVIYLNQTDEGYDKQFLIYNGDQPYNAPEGISVTIRGKKGDLNGITENVTYTVGSNLMTAHITQQMTAVAGDSNIFELVIVDTAGLRVGTINMIFAVEPDALGDAVISESEIGYAETVLTELQSVQAVNNQVQQNKANIAKEVQDRISAVNAEASARQTADTALQNNINTESNRAKAAENTLQQNISTEASARATTDANLQSQISQIVAPSGEAPSAAEVQNARIGADNVTYPTLGDAIRGQVTDLKSAVTGSLVNKTIYVNTWGASAISPATGQNTSASNRCRTNFFTQFDSAYPVIRFIVPSDMKANWFEYSTDSLSSFTKAGSLNEQVGGFSFVPDPARYYRFVIAYADDRNFARTDIVNDSVYYITYMTTDINLSQSQKAADAKAVGDLLADGVLHPKRNISVTEWTQGSISSTSGTNQTSTTRCRSTNFFSFSNAGIITITVADGYKISGREYYFASNSTFAKFNLDFTAGNIILKVTPKNYYRFVIAKIDDSAVAPSDLPDGVVIITPHETDYTLPLYWQSYMSTKIPELQAMDADHGKSSKFVFITDVHWESNRRISPDLIKQIQDNTSVKRVICGGDLLDYEADKSVAIDLMNGFLNSIDHMGTVCGNHDDNGESTSATGTELLNEAARYGVITRKSQNYIDAKNTYYVWKDEGLNIAYIVLDTTDYKILATQRAWLVEQIQTLYSDYRIVIVTHIYYNGYDSESGQLIYHDPTAGVIDAVIGGFDSAVQDKIICIVSGHTHRDFVYRNAYGIPVIVTKCDAFDKDHDEGALDMVPGTITEQAFDVYFIDLDSETIYIKRIGSGLDRIVPIRTN